MSRFLTLIRKDLADYRGALVWTPVVVAGILLALSLVSTLMGRFEPGYDFERGLSERHAESSMTDGGSTAEGATPRSGDTDIDIDIDGKGEPVIRFGDRQARIDGKLDAEDRPIARSVIVVATSAGAMLPVGIATIVIIFTLLGALYDERKDRSILFWKSMPTSDLETVLSKIVTIGGIGLGTAFAVGLVTHLGLVTLGLGVGSRFGTGFIGADTIGLMGQTWALLGLTVTTYLLWVLPVYAWILFASAASPKAPILLGLVPLALVPIAASVVGLSNELLLEPASRLIGEPMWSLFEHVEDGSMTGQGVIDFSPLFSALGASYTQPGLWIGLLVAAGLLYATAEVRRRKAL